MRGFNLFTALRSAGVSLTELVRDFGKKRAMEFEKLYQSLYREVLMK